MAAWQITLTSRAKSNDAILSSKVDVPVFDVFLLTRKNLNMCTADYVKEWGVMQYKDTLVGGSSGAVNFLVQ
jgi:hypothetical protein